MFYEKTVNNFLNCEQKIICAKKRVNNFLNNAKHKIILCKILEIVYAENSKQFFMRKQWTVLINAKNRFYEKTVNNLCSEQRIIYAEKRVNNFLNNAEHKIILCRMLEIVYAENSEHFLWENNEQF